MAERRILWLASYPKSGNTWIASILEAAGCRFGYATGRYDAYHLEATGSEPQVCECVDPVVGIPASILKTHAQYDPNGLPHRFHAISAVTGGYIHIYRNPLDVLLSYIGFTRLEYRLKADDSEYRTRLFVDLLGFPAPVDYPEWQQVSLERIPTKNLDHALDAFAEAGLSIPTLDAMCGSWIGHYRSWTTGAAALPGCSFRYEDCLDKPSEFARLSRLVRLDEARIIRGVEEANRGTAERARTGSARDRIFFSKRRARYFREYFSGPAIDRFLARHGDALEETGYTDILQEARR